VFGVHVRLFFINLEKESQEIQLFIGLENCAWPYEVTECMFELFFVIVIL
jgi:hypothetical protein